MDTNTFQAKWSTIKSLLQQKFNKLTVEDIAQINGKREVFISKIQQRYGYDLPRVEKELAAFEGSCGCGSKKGACGSEASVGQSRQQGQRPQGQSPVGHGGERRK